MTGGYNRGADCPKGGFTGRGGSWSLGGALQK